MLDYVESMAVALSKHTKPYFAFNWATRLAHDDFNTLSLGDEPLLSTLSFLHEGNYLNNSALIILGDHGPARSSLIQTEQGRLEDRLPVLYIVLPPWFPQKYPKPWKNLQDNQDALLSAWDLRKTVMQFSDLDKLQQQQSNKQTIKQRGRSRTGLEAISMLETVASPNRSCSAAGIEAVWCYCHRRKKLKVDNWDVKDGAAFVLRSINNVTANAATKNGSLCSAFSILRIVSASKSILTGDLIGNLVLDVSFIVRPGLASFDATIYRRKEETASSSSSSPSWSLLGKPLRTNRYKGQSDCVKDKDLQPYCFCMEDYKMSVTQ
jgi:hypothetical protein